MTNQTTLYHRGYHGSVEVDPDEGMLYGQVLWIRDLISYQGETVAQLRVDFETAVDDYLVQCKRRGVDPKRPFTGTIQIRIGAELHEEVAISAHKNGESINRFIKECLRKHVAEKRTAKSDRLYFTYEEAVSLSGVPGDEWESVGQENQEGHPSWKPTFPNDSLKRH